MSRESGHWRAGSRRRVGADTMPCRSTRRKLILALGACALAVPIASFAQPKGKVWRIGYLYAGTRQVTVDSGRMSAFLQGMKELGYVEGKHFVMTSRYGETQVD